MTSRPPTESGPRDGGSESANALSTETVEGSLGAFRELTRKIFGVTPAELRETAEHKPKKNRLKSNS